MSHDCISVLVKKIYSSGKKFLVQSIKEFVLSLNIAKMKRWYMEYVNRRGYYNSLIGCIWIVIDCSVVYR